LLATLGIWLWIAVLVLATVGSAIDDYRDGESPPELALNVGTGLVCVAAVLSLWSEAVSTALGRVLLPLAICAGVLLLREMVMDLRRNDGQRAAQDATSRSEVLIGVSIFGITFGGAVGLGIVLGSRAW